MDSSIREIIARNEKRNAETRLARLTMDGAPQAILDGLKAKIENPTKGISKLDLFGDLVPLTFEQKTGKGGKPYVRFTIEDQRDVCYIPMGQFGPYLYQESK